MRDRLIELLKQADENTSSKGITDYNDAIPDNADYLLANGVIVLPCKVGEKIYVVIYDDVIEEWYIAEERVAEVGTRGVFTNANAEPKEGDFLYFPYESCGKQIDNEYVCYTREEAERALEERM